MEDGITLSVRAIPKAARNAVVGVMETTEGRAAKISVTAVPDKGKANMAVLALLAKTFGVSKRDVTLVSGSSDRRKVVRVVGDPAKLSAIVDHWSLI